MKKEVERIRGGFARETEKIGTREKAFLPLSLLFCFSLLP
jgi:hypothetical protein